MGNVCYAVKVLHRVQVQSAASVRHSRWWPRHIRHHWQAGPGVCEWPVSGTVPWGEGVFNQETYTRAVWRALSQGSHWTSGAGTLRKVSKLFSLSFLNQELIPSHYSCCCSSVLLLAGVTLFKKA